MRGVPSTNEAAFARIESMHNNAKAKRQPNIVAKRIEASPELEEKL
jgi:hypothetical protein